MNYEEKRVGSHLRREKNTSMNIKCVLLLRVLDILSTALSGRAITAGGR
jgi:hypothetical protein